MPQNDYNYGKAYIWKQDKEKWNRPDAPLTRFKKDFDAHGGTGQPKEFIQAVPTKKSAKLSSKIMNADKEKPLNGNSND